MPRYESGTGANRRFWEIDVIDNQLRTRHGRVGSNGRLSDPKTFKTAEDAHKDANKRIAGKVRQGFERVDDHVLAMAEDPALIEAIIDGAGPTHEGPYLVYSDWLQSQGDARGELIMVQKQLQADPDNTTLQKTEDKLIKKLSPERLYKMHKKKRSKNKRKDSGYTHLDWKLGFIVGARVARNSERPPYTIRELTTTLLAHPSARVLRSLEIGALGGKGDYDYTHVVEAIRRAAPTSLRHLTLAEFDGEEHADLSASTLGDISGLYPVLPRLETLHLRAGTMDIGDIVLPSLRTLAITTIVFEQRALQSVAQASWPHLASLRLRAGGTALPYAGIADIGTAPDMKALRNLSLEHTDETGEVWRGVLRDSALLSRLDTLALPYGSLTDHDVDDLLAQRHQLEHLRLLDLQGNYLSEDATRAIHGVCKSVLLSNQRPPASSRDSFTDQQINEFAPDAKSILAARKIAKPNKWLLLGSDGEYLWGRCQGSSLYQVFVNVDDMESACECPSQKYPCKHAIALLMLAQGNAVPTNRLPDGFLDDVESARYDSPWE